MSGIGSPVCRNWRRDLVMLLIQNGFCCEYEMNIFIRLFFPGVEDGIIFTDVKYNDGIISSYCQINYRGGVYFGSFSLDYVKTGDKKRDERYFSITCTRAFTDCAGKINNVSLPWGVMCGVRPAKSVTKFSDEGMSYPKIKEHLKIAYGVSDKKCDLAIEVSKNEDAVLKNIKKNSASIYIGIPFCPSRCLYCSFVSTDTSVSGRYMDDFLRLLVKEIERTGEMVKRLGTAVENIYIGGGTPTTLNEKQLEILLSAVNNNFDVKALGEFTLEAGRPDTVTREKLLIAKGYGVDRVSINPQSTNDETLKRIGRRHTNSMFYDAYNIARDVGFKVINTDTIAGLPGEMSDDFKNTIKELIKLSPENITVHSMCIKRAADLKNKANSLTGYEIMNEMLDFAYSALTASGYTPYYMYRQKNISGNLENVGYAKPGTSSFYNVNIMEEAQTIIALGGGGTSKLVTKNGIERICNFKDPLEYINRFDEILLRKEEAEKILMDCN